MNQILSLVLSAVGALLLVTGLLTMIFSRKVAQNALESGVLRLGAGYGRVAIVAQGGMQVVLAIPFLLFAQRTASSSDADVAGVFVDWLRGSLGPASIWVTLGVIVALLLGLSGGLLMIRGGFRAATRTNLENPFRYSDHWRLIMGIVVIILCLILAALALLILFRLISAG